MVATPRSQPGGIAAPLLLAAVRLLSLVALIAAPAAAQIFKCTDGAGNVTYQNEACPRNAKAGRVDIFDNSWTADRAEKDAEWRRNATQHRVVAGMPLRWVREALGEPSEVRDTATAGAAEVWLYNFPERSVQVGIRDAQVLWSRETPVIASATRIAPEPDRAGTQAPRAMQGAPLAIPDTVRATPDLPGVMPESPRVTESPRTASESPRSVTDSPRTVTESPRTAPESPRTVPEIQRALPPTAKVSESGRGVARGQDCKQALAALGAPDRQREVPAFDSASDPVTEYFYEAAGSENSTRTRIVCANGKVEGVERTVIR